MYSTKLKLNVIENDEQETMAALKLSNILSPAITGYLKAREVRSKLKKRGNDMYKDFTSYLSTSYVDFQFIIINTLTSIIELSIEGSIMNEENTYYHTQNYNTILSIKKEGDEIVLTLNIDELKIFFAEYGLTDFSFTKDFVQKSIEKKVIPHKEHLRYTIMMDLVSHVLKFKHRENHKELAEKVIKDIFWY